MTVTNNDTVDAHRHLRRRQVVRRDASTRGKTATFTAPAKAGTYKFHCNIHSQMHGTLTVT